MVVVKSFQNGNSRVIKQERCPIGVLYKDGIGMRPNNLEALEINIFQQNKFINIFKDF